jgi:hypothetical protein
LLTLSDSRRFLKWTACTQIFYPVQSNGYLADFVLPQDKSPKNYLVNQNISFAIDLTRLQIPQDALEKTTFSWDFKDGSKTTGLSATHTYKKPGSYILEISADSTAFDKDIPVQVIQSTMINVLPTNDYKMPQAKVTVNGKTVANPSKDILPVNTTNEVVFDASTSQGQIASYYWDFDDGKGSHEKITTYKYAQTRTFLAPVLRVIDNNGFISDAYIVLKVDNKNGTTPLSQKQTVEHKSSFPWIPIIVGVLVVGGAGIVLRRKKTK